MLIKTLKSDDTYITFIFSHLSDITVLPRTPTKFGCSLTIFSVQGSGQSAAVSESYPLSAAAVAEGAVTLGQGRVGLVGLRQMKSRSPPRIGGGD